MTQGRRASGGALRGKLEEQHQEALARGFDAQTGRTKDQEFVRCFHALVQRILDTPPEEIANLRLVSAGELTGGDDGAWPAASARQGQELVIFRRLAEASGYGFCVADVKGTITYANHALCRLLAEHDPEDVLGRNITTCYPDEVQEAFAINIIPTVVKNGQWVGELPLRSAAGQRTPTLQNIFLVHGAAGTPPYLGNLIIDITDRIRAEEGLRQSEERYRNLIENMQDAVYTIDTNGIFTFMSKAVEAFTGYRSEDVVGRSFREFIYQDDREELERQFRDLVQGVTPGPSEYRILTRSVDVRWVRSSTRPMVSGGKVVGVQGVITDITARKRVEQALRSSEEKFSQAFRLSPDGMFIFRIAEGEILDVNESFLRTTGLPRSEVVGKSTHALLYWPLPGGRDAFVRSLGDTGAADSAEGALRSSDGRLIPVLVSARSIEVGGEPHAICVARDITHRRRFEESIRRQRDLSLDLRTAQSPDEAIRLCVEAALAVAEMDAGGFYALDRDSGELELRYGTGLSPEFLHRNRRFSADSEPTRLVLAGKPVYTQHERFEGPPTPGKPGEGLRAVAVIPVATAERVVGVLNVASRIRAEVPESAREPLEAVATQIGSVLAQAEAAEALRNCERMHRLLAGAMNEGVAWHRLVHDARGEPVDYEFVDVNPAFERLLGVTREAVVGKRARDVYGGDQPFHLERFRRVALSEEQAHFSADCPACAKHVRIRAFSPCRGQFIAVIREARASQEEPDSAAPAGSA